ncbi:MAG: dTDP-4-dehydrorhamnose 3,5-epimerase [Acetobacteraceae bacterium]|nr:dTDP-4-dehydrorhamnose 3,5-epimerase [Acetobacteraceae bacterium]
MIFAPTPLPGLMLVRAEWRNDARGGFARAFCEAEFAAAGLPTRFPQCNLSVNAQRGTVRGMHLQADPWPEGKLVRCVAGAVFDVAVDLRPGSPTRGRWHGVELTAEGGDAFWIPPGFAHGFQALSDGATLFYMMTESYRPGAERGVRFDDPAFGIAWPLPPAHVAEKDRSWPDFVP